MKLTRTLSKYTVDHTTVGSVLSPRGLRLDSKQGRSLLFCHLNEDVRQAELPALKQKHKCLKQVKKTNFPRCIIQFIRCGR